MKNNDEMLRQLIIENEKLRQELEELKIKYNEETEIIVKLDKKIFDLRMENAKLKLEIVLLKDNQYDLL